jgi:anti-sigma B factor antagonist
MTDLEITQVSPERYRLRGELDMASAVTFEDALSPVVQGGTQLVLDLEDLTFIDSSGLRALVQLSDQMNGSAPLVLSNVPHGVQRLLDIVGLNTLPGIEVRDDA